MAETMEDRERELIGKIEQAKRSYMRAIEPWLQELGNIRACRPPAPVVLDDGRVVHYIGSLPTWTPDGIKPAA